MRRLGRVIGTRPAGLTLIIPVVDRLDRVSLRIVTMPIQSQGIITRDNVSVDVSAVAYYRVVDAVKSVVAIENVQAAINLIAAEGESLAADALGAASDIMMAHPLALQLRNLQSLVEIGVDKNTTVVFPAPLMSTIGELGSFLARETAATSGAHPTQPPSTTASNGKPAAPGATLHDTP